MNELRRDYFLDRWVIISTGRAKRPSDFIQNKAPAAGGDVAYVPECSFCQGYEHKTPPSKASYFIEEGHICQKPDIAGEKPFTRWVVRVIPNLYPAVEPGDMRTTSETAMVASGVHEVIVESPLHNRHPQFMSDEEIKRLFTVYRDRFEAAAKVPYVKYVSLFRNYGKEAGASLSHAHSQLMALPIVPAVIEEQFGLDYSEVLGAEARGPRLIMESEHTLVFSPFASCLTYETWVFPRRRCKNIAGLSAEERDDFALAARNVLSRMSKLLGDPPYNYAFVQSVSEDMHMNLRIYPKLGIEAGFELNTRIHINSVPPEEAARSLRDVRSG